MLIVRGLLAAIYAAAIPFTIVYWMSWDSSFHEPPKAGSENKKTEEQSPKNCSTFSCVVFVPIGNFIHDNRDEINAVSTAIIAIFTMVLGIFTVSLARSTRIAANAASKATQTAQAEFVASHRPQLRVRNVVVDRPQAPEKFGLFAPDHLVSGRLFISNVGGSRADILDGHCMVFWSNSGLPMQTPYEGGADNLQAAERTLLSGQSTVASFRSSTPLKKEVSDTIGLGVMGGHKLYVMGWVNYCDRNNDVRRTAFCREFRSYMPHGGHWGRFHPVNDPDYENEE